MKVYYRGQLLKTDIDDFNNWHKLFEEKDFDIKKYDHLLSVLTPEEIKYIKKHLVEWKINKYGIGDTTLINILNKIRLRPFNTSYYDDIYIIYELIEDVNGNFYGKEMLTGLLFPILKNEKILYTYTFKKIMKDTIPTLEKKVICKDSNLAKFTIISTLERVASINEVNRYNELKNKKNDYDKFINQVTDKYNENVFCNEIIEKKKTCPEKQNEQTKIMENIEYYLLLLKKYNTELYNKINNEYENLYDHNLNQVKNPIFTNEYLLNFESKVKLDLLFAKENTTNIIEYLDCVTPSYLSKTIDNEITSEDLNINDIENIIDLFLKQKNDFDIPKQRTILRKISLLYLLILKNNIEKVNEKELKNSYLNDNLKSILISINLLFEEGIIESDIATKNLENISLDTTMDIIKNISFKIVNKNNIKKLIK